MNQQAKEYTGVNDLIMSGTPMRGNASASAASIGQQREAPSLRLLMVVLSIENFLLTPMLYKMFKMHQIHTQGDRELRGMNPEGQVSVSNQSMGREVRFMMLSATRMMSREKLLQIFPFVTQYLINPELMSLFQKSGQTVDIAEWLRMLQDAAGTKYTYKLVRPLSDEEKQAMMQPTPEMVQDQQKTQASNEVRLAMADKKIEAEKLKSGAKLQETDKKSQADLQREMIKTVLGKLLAGGQGQGEISA